MKNSQPSSPRLANKLLLWFLKSDLAEEVLGDLEEQYEVNLEKYSIWKTKLLYWYQVIHYFRPFALKNSSFSNINFFTMFRHNFKLTYRSFLKYKGSFFINLTSLSTGLAFALLIYLWVNDEMSVDKFHEHDTRLFQLLENQEHTGSIRSTHSTPWLLAETLKEEMPEVEFASVATPWYWYKKFTLSVDDKVTKGIGQYVGEDYFKMFSYPIIHGDKNQVLSDKNSIVISENLALKLFNTQDNVVGKTIFFEQEKEFKVSGVFKDIPTKSSTRLDFALSVEILKDSQPESLSWGNSGPFTYVMLKEATNPRLFNQKIKDLISSKISETHRTLLLTKYSDNYLHGNYENGVQTGGRIEYVNLFSIIAVFIILIASINFMNLSTARASRRMKEIGVKKAMGINRTGLIYQYLTESLTLSFLAMVVALVMVSLVLPQFNEIMGKRLSLLPETNIVLAFLAITVITGLLSGSYPAFYLSGIHPIPILKGKLPGSISELWTRRGLVIFQFSLSVIFIVGVLIVYKQINFVQSKNIGYNKENVIYFDREGKVLENTATFLHELEKIPGIKQVSSSGQSPIGGGNTSNINWEGKDPSIRIPFAIRPANYDLLELLHFELKEGRFFSEDHADSMAVVFNEAGIEAMGMEDPIGKVIEFGPYNSTIIGVIKNFNFESLRTEVKPMFFILAPQYTEKIMVRLEQEKMATTLDEIDEFYKKFNPGFAFDFRFIDQDYQQQYASEQRIGMLSKYFAGIAILISCLGLFGLAAFTAERRLKEIGIRKVLGATELGIIKLLSGEFTNMVLVSIAMAIPLSYWIAVNWLDGFAYKIELSWWYFAGAALIVLLINWLTVLLQTLKVVKTNPVKCLKDE